MSEEEKKIEEVEIVKSSHVASTDSTIEEKKIEEVLDQRYFDYAKYVIEDRAVPDIRDGLKPVHRRSLYGLYELRMFSNTPTKKCAKVTGHVMGSYHPHGDSSVYGSIIRLVQSWTMSVPLIHGQGNFGSYDGDPAAAMRYTECRLEAITEEAMLQDLDKNVVNFIPTFDDEGTEPEVLPVRFPNALVNPNSAMAVAISTDILPHNLDECCNAALLLMETPDVSDEKLMKVLPGPDFPMGGIVVTNKPTLEGILKTGKGTIRLEAKFEEIQVARRNGLKITEFPYGVTKSTVMSQIAEGVKKGRIDSIYRVLDESDQTGACLILDFSKKIDVSSMIVKLKSATSLSNTYKVQMVFLVEGKVPRQLGTRDVLLHFLKFRRESVVRRTNFELKKAIDEEHMVDGLTRVFTNLDKAIAIIRSGATLATIRNELKSAFMLDDVQCERVLEMQLRRLSKLDENQLRERQQALAKQILEMQETLADSTKVDKIIRKELLEIKRKYATPRKTQIQIT